MAANVVAVVKNWSARIEPQSPVPLVYSLHETVKQAQNDYRKFKSIVLEQSLEAELESAVAELWRLSVLHRRRIHGLRWAVRWLVLSVAAVALTAVASIWLP
jgi:hypothetical protein